MRRTFRSLNLVVAVLGDERAARIERNLAHGIAKIIKLYSWIIHIQFHNRPKLFQQWTKQSKCMS